MPVRFDTFRGETPKPNRWARDYRTASQAVDVDVKAGSLRPRDVPQLAQSLSDTGQGVVAVAIGGTCTFVGVDEPTKQVNARARSYFPQGGNVWYAGSDCMCYKLGVPAPTKAPTAAVMEDDEGTSTDQSVFQFFYTFVNKDDEEGDPSPPLGMPLTARDDDTITITVPAHTEEELDELFEDRPAEGWKVRFYVGNEAGNGNLLHEAPLGESAITHKYTLGDTLGETYVVDDYSTMPPEGVTSVVSMRGGFLAVSAEDMVHMSEVGLHNRWPRRHARRLGAPLLALETWSDLLYAFPQNDSPVVITSPEPASFSTYDTQIPWPCLSGASVANTGHGVMYASRSGIVSLRGSQGALETIELFDARTFKDFIPERIRAYANDGIYHAYGNDRPFTLDYQALSGKVEMTEETYTPTDVVVVDSVPYGRTRQQVWNYLPSARTLSKTFKWRSNIVHHANPVRYSKVQVRFDEDPKVFADFPHINQRELMPGAMAPGHADAMMTLPIETEAAVGIRMLGEDGRPLLANEVSVPDSKEQPINMRKNTDAFQVEVSANTEVLSITFYEHGGDQSAGRVPG